MIKFNSLSSVILLICICEFFLVLIQFNELQECYLQKRRHGASQLHRQDDRDVKALNREGYHAGLEDFQSVLTTFTRYRFQYYQEAAACYFLYAIALFFFLTLSLLLFLFFYCSNS